MVPDDRERQRPGQKRFHEGVHVRLAEEVGGLLHGAGAVRIAAVEGGFHEVGGHGLERVHIGLQVDGVVQAVGFRIQDDIVDEFGHGVRGGTDDIEVFILQDAGFAEVLHQVQQDT